MKILFKMVAFWSNTRIILNIIASKHYSHGVCYTKLRFDLSVVLLNWLALINLLNKCEKMKTFFSFLAIFFLNGTKTRKSPKNFFLNLSVFYTVPKFWHLNSGHPVQIFMFVRISMLYALIQFDWTLVETYHEYIMYIRIQSILVIGFTICMSMYIF